MDLMSKIRSTIQNLANAVGSAVMAPGMYLGEKLYDVTHPEPLDVVSPLPKSTPTPSIPQPTSTPTTIPNPTVTPTPQVPVPNATPTIIPQFAGVRPTIQDLIAAAFTQNPNEAINVAARESSLIPSTTHPNIDENGNVTSTDYGLFQINDRAQAANLANQGFTIEDMLKAADNVRFAKWLYEQQGWNPWVAAQSLGYTK